MPKDKSTGKKLADMMYGSDQMRATPQSRITGPVANALRKAQQFAGQYEIDPRIPLLGGTGIDELFGLPDAASLMEDVSYNGPGALVRGGNAVSGGMGTFRQDPRLLTALDVGATATGVGKLGLSAARAAPGALAAGARNLSAPRTLNPQAGVIKTKGGNWLNSGSVERSLEGLKRKVTSENLANYTPEQAERLAASGRLDRNDALNKWVDRNLTNYIKKEMATPEDPVRRLAEEGVVHISPGQVGINRYKAPKVREVEGGEALGMSDEARAWEDSTDVAISPITIKSLHPDYREPWMESASPSTRVYEPTRNFDTRALGFDHIMDVLREDLATGRIRPEQLSKVSMEQAVRRTYEYDQELAKKAAEARAVQREGLPVYKDYPEGYRWIELNKPGSFASESEAMGHSVRGYEPPKGHPDWTEGSGDAGSLGYGHGGWEAIKSGKAKVYSLVDSKGNPHVTVESRAPDARSNYEEMRAIENQADNEADAQGFTSFAERDRFTESRVRELKNQLMAQKQPEGNYRITQIKGKGNAAPKEDYLPFVQDFVRSGQWDDVGDFQNTGLAKLQEGSDLAKWLQKKNIELPKYPTKKELNNYEADFLLDQLGADKFNELGLDFLKGDEGMARGGRVHISDNPDVMQLEMAAGGIAKLAKLARAPAKSKQEIQAIAERMAPQVTGEYVRESAKSAKTVAGKTQKQFQREKSLPVDVRPTDSERIPQPVDIEKLKDEVMIGIPGDPTLAGKTLYGVGDVRLGSPSPQHGGPLYGLYNDPNFWASGEDAAKKVQNLARSASELYDAPVLGNYIMMGPDSLGYAQHFADANLQAIDLSKMTKQQIEMFNEIIREGYNYKKKGERFQRVFPSFPGIEDKDSAYLHMAMDPDLRKHFNEVMQKPTVTEPLNLPSGQDIRFAITEPALRDMESGVTGYSIGRMRPDVSSEGLKLSQHPTYSHDIPGQFMGTSKYPMPYELTFPDTVKSIRENPRQAPYEFGTLQYGSTHQTIDQQMIDEIRAYEERMKQLTGKKAGGAVRMAGGGEVHGLSTADLLFLQSQEDLGKLPAHAQREAITNMGGQEVRQRMAGKMAAGGEITADDLILEERKL
jgi:hypothetical protein